MIRRLLFLAFVLWLIWLVRVLARLRRSASTGATASNRRGPRALRSEGTMVRDRVCNTFLPRERALRVRRGGEEHFFCSEACRDKFLASARR